MSTTPDRFPGPEECEELRLDLDTVDPTVAGAVKYVSGAFRAKDTISVFNHRLGDLFLEGDPTTPNTTYENTYTGNKITQERNRRVDTTLLKSIDYTYTGNKITTIVTKIFAPDGSTIVQQITKTYAYTGNDLTGGSVTRDV